MRVQMSMVNRVLLLLKMEAKDDMRAANITASIRPRKPAHTQSDSRTGDAEEVGWRGRKVMRNVSNSKTFDTCPYHWA